MSDRGGAITQDVLLRVRAQNQATTDLKAATDSINAMTAAVARNSEAARTGAISSGELKSEIGKLNEAAKQLTSISALVGRFRDFNDQVEKQTTAVEAAKKALADHQAALAASGSELKKDKDQVDRLTRALEAAQKSLQKSQADHARYGETLRKAGVDTKNLAEAERLLVQSYTAGEAGLVELNKALVDYDKN